MTEFRVKIKTRITTREFHIYQPSWDKVLDICFWAFGDEQIIYLSISPTK